MKTITNLLCGLATFGFVSTLAIADETAKSTETNGQKIEQKTETTTEYGAATTAPTETQKTTKKAKSKKTVKAEKTEEKSETVPAPAAH